MTKESAKKAAALTEEIDSLSKYIKFLQDREYGGVVHFELKQHYGNCSEYGTIVIDKKHNDEFLGVLKKVILCLETKLENLS